MSAMEGAASEAEAEEEAEEEEEEEEVVAEGAAPAPLEEECLRFMVEGVYVGLRRGGDGGWMRVESKGFRWRGPCWMCGRTDGLF